MSVLNWCPHCEENTGESVCRHCGSATEKPPYTPRTYKAAQSKDFPLESLRESKRLEYELQQTRDALSALIYSAERAAELIISTSDRYDIDVAIESAKEALK